MDDHLRFRKFLAGLKLSDYEHYRNIKIVELNMPKHVQALACLYRQYWDKRKNWVEYESFYKIYKKELSKELEEWRKKCQFSKETFHRGLPARIYRTWFSLLTQIQGAYIAESIHGKGNVHMGVSEDRHGKDLVINLGENIGKLPVQIKKLSNRTDVHLNRSRKDKFVRVEYEVSPPPKTPKTGKDSVRFKRWQEKWGDKLERLDNGFVIFRANMFKTPNLLSGIVE